MWLLVYLSNCIWCQQRSILHGKGKARPRWGNERTWSGIERTLHCTINIMDHILHIKHFKEIVTGWEKFAGFQVFLRVTIFVSTLLAQQCKNYMDLRASTLYYEAGMNLYRTLHIAQYTCFFYSPPEAIVKGLHVVLSEATLYKIYNIVPPEATNELVVQTWTGSGQSYFWKIAPSSSSEQMYSLKIKIRDFFFAAASLKIKT